MQKPRKRSGGPRTEAGKARSSHNALKHGLAASRKEDPLLLQQSKELALALCGGTENQILFIQALEIAGYELLLRRIGGQKLILIERIEDFLAIPIATSKDVEDPQNASHSPTRKFKDRDEFAVMQEAMLNLDRVRRYERRAWSRLGRAMREFTAIMARTEDNSVRTKEAGSNL